jgi:formiminotetrahydrofolate cyclodeaminase
MGEDVEHASVGDWLGQTIGQYLSALSDRVPAPGGGAAAAVSAAQGAALVGMVARYTSGKKYEAHAALVKQIEADTDSLRYEACALALADANAFNAVATAYQLPNSAGEEHDLRRRRIEEALAAAAEPPIAVVQVALSVLAAAEKLLPVANRNVISDIAAATESVRAAATTARLNIEINARGVTEEAATHRMRAAVEQVSELLPRLEAVESTVRELIAR